MSVKIPAVVNGSYINCDNYVAGAQGSFNDVVLRVKLTGDWIIGDSGTKSIVASFVDARGRTASAVIVLPSMAVPGEENTYDIPIPAAAKQYEGDISVVLSGYDQSISEGGYQEFSGDSSTTEFTINNVSPVPDVIFEVALDGIVIAPSEYTYNSENGKVTFRSAPESGDTIKVTYQQHVITQITRTANCFMRVLSSDFVIVDGSELDADLVSQINAEIAALNGRVTTVEQEVNEFDADFDAKADKVALAVAGHFAGLDANGNLTDSGKAVTELVNNLTVFPIVYWRNDTPPHTGEEGDYWYAPSVMKLYETQNVNGTLEWVDVTDEQLVEKNTFIKNDGQIFVCEYGELVAAKAVPMNHTHTKSDITDFAHTHVKSDITDFAHTHTLSQITGLPVPTIADAGKFIMVNPEGEYVLSSASPTPVTTFTISLNGMGADPLCCCWLKSDPSTVYYDENGGYMGSVEIASNDALVCHVSNSMQAVTLNGDTQTLVNNECEITPTSDMALTFNYTGPGGESVIQIVTLG